MRYSVQFQAHIGGILTENLVYSECGRVTEVNGLHEVHDQGPYPTTSARTRRRKLQPPQLCYHDG